MCENRGIEPNKQLLSYIYGDDVYPGFCSLFEKAVLKDKIVDKLPRFYVELYVLGRKLYFKKVKWAKSGQRISGGLV